MKISLFTQSFINKQHLDANDVAEMMWLSKRFCFLLLLISISVCCAFSLCRQLSMKTTTRAGRGCARHRSSPRQMCVVRTHVPDGAKRTECIHFTLFNGHRAAHYPRLLASRMLSDFLNFAKNITLPVEFPCHYHLQFLT